MSTTTADSKHTFSRIRFSASRPVERSLAAVGIVALSGAVVLSAFTANGSSRLAHAYLLAVSFFLSISLGALFFVVLQHLVAARWSIVIRRIAEMLTQMLPMLALLDGAHPGRTIFWPCGFVFLE